MTIVEQSQGRFFVQDDRDDPFWLLTCTGVGDVSIPSGDETAVYCPSPVEVGAFIIEGTIEGVADLVGYTLERPLTHVLNTLLEDLHNCRWHGRINWSVKGTTASVVTDYLVAMMLFRCRATNRGVASPTTLDPTSNERVMTNADISAYEAWMYYPLTATRIALTEVSGINGVDFDLSSQCAVEEIGGNLPGKEGYFTTDHTSTSPAVSADVWYTTDYGVTWTLCTTDPFGAAEDAGPCVTLGGRVVVGRITADAGNPAEIGYSDDFGTTWNNVDLGATDNQTVDGLWWLDWTHLWACCSGGYVYFSENGGETWTAQTSGTVTAQNLQDICAYDSQNVWAVGAAGAIIRTTDGANWALVTGPAAVADQFNTVFMCNSIRVFIGSNAGNVYRWFYDGATEEWTTYTTPAWAGGEVRSIRGELDRRYTIFIAGDTDGPVGDVYRSEDGGATFQDITQFPLNAGLNDLAIIDHNTAWAGGEPQAGTAFLAKIHSVS